MSESILRSTLRALFSTVGKMLGFLIGLIPIILLIAGAFTYEDERPYRTFNEEVIPDLSGKRHLLSSHKPTVLQIDISGIIGEKLSKERLSEMLTESREGNLKNDLVKALLLYINTPGGTMIDSDGIYRAIKEYKAKYNVPVYAYVDGLCASGGMYIACAADKIYASDISMIGSVGVILSTFVNVADTLDKLGVKTLSISEGKDKDALNPLRPWKPDEGANYQFLTKHAYDKFLEIVTSNRPQINKDQLVENYGAKIFPASFAKEYGFIDEVVGSKNDALLALLDKAEIPHDQHQVIKLERENFLTNLLKLDSSILSGKVEHRLNLGLGFSPELQNKILYLYRQ